MQSVRLIDEPAISRKLKHLSRCKQSSDSDQREKSVLESKLRSRQEQIEEINSMLDGNDEAIAALERTIAEISRMKTGAQYGDTDLETAISEMKNIAERANRMGRTSSPGADIF
jgi:predicted RNase H-like nuclease (RuvC/YqgF family)